jgi:cyclase
MLAADELCFLDITASHEERPILLDRLPHRGALLHAAHGGWRRPQWWTTAHAAHAGADKVSFNTAAVSDPEVVRAASARFGAQCVVVAIDAVVARAGRPDARMGGVHARRRHATGLTRSSGRRAWSRRRWRHPLTSMDRDGTKEGYDLPLTRAIVDRVDIPVIASGGAGTLEHLREGLTAGGASAALVASIFHYGTHTIGEAKAYLASRGVCIRQDGGAA